MWTFIIIVVIGVIVYLAYKNKQEGGLKKEKLKGGNIVDGMFGFTKTIKQEKIIDRWSTLIDGANGQGEQVIAETIRIIEKLEAPNIFVSRQKRKPGPGFTKTPREFLIAEHRILDGYDMYIGARDYGKQLFVSWCLIEEPISFWRLFKRNPILAIFKLPLLIFGQAIAKMQGGSGQFMSLLNLFDTEELTAYTTTVHHALLDSVKVVMENQKLDFTGIEKRTKGFLNIA
ncbi:MAG TPA: hypothetical protein VI981_03155 [Candidatus Paceibacterota bacterium]